MFRQKPIKPVIENMIQLQGKIRVRTAIAYCFCILCIQFVKVSAVCNIRKSGQPFMTQFFRQFFQTAVSKFAKCVVAFQGHLCCTNGIIHRRLYDDILLTGYCRFKGDIVSNFDDIFVCEKVLQKSKKSNAIHVSSNFMINRNIDPRMLFDRKTASGHMAFLRIQSRLFFHAVRLVRCSLIVKSHNCCIADILLNFLHRSDTSVILHSILLNSAAP